MGQPLRILLVEDSPEDAEILLRELRRGGFDVEHERVASADSMRAALQKPGWELIISASVMPGFGGKHMLGLSGIWTYLGLSCGQFILGRSTLVQGDTS